MKSKHLQEQLKELKSEIEVLKVEEKETYEDRIHEEKQASGETKYITLRKVGCKENSTNYEFWFSQV